MVFLAVVAAANGRAGLGSLVEAVFSRVAAIAKSPTDAAPARDAGTEYWPLFAGVTLLMAIAGFGGFLWFAALNTEPWYFLPLMALAAACFEIGLPGGRHVRAAIFGFAVTTVFIADPRRPRGFDPAIHEH